MNDRELLELAAKAAGFTKSKVTNNGWFYVCTYAGHNGDDSDSEWEIWSPLTDDGDAFRLAVKLDLFCDTGLTFQFMEAAGDCAATRRAIVEAAAVIGKSMP